MKMSQRISAFQVSPIRRLVPYANAAKARGVHIYHLNIGQPDIKTPIEALDAIRSYDKEIIAYGPSDGEPELRQGIADYYSTLGVNIAADDILMTTGASEAIQFAFVTLCDVGDEVIICEPFYTNVGSFARSALVNMVPVTSTLEKNFALPSIDDFERAISPRTKAIMLCSPNNPTGYIFSPQELEAILALAKKHNLFLIVDEVYREFCYDDHSFTSVLRYEEYAENVLVIDSFSKRFSMCGARIGMLVTRNKEIRQGVMKLAQARLCPPDIEQWVAIQALKTESSYIANVRQEYQKRRDFIVNRLRSIEGVRCTVPQGAFYLIADLPVDDAEKFAIFLLQDFSLNGETVMVAPAEDFYISEKLGKNQVRLAYVLNTEDLERALMCLEEGLKQYQKERMAL